MTGSSSTRRSSWSSWPPPGTPPGTSRSCSRTARVGALFSGDALFPGGRILLQDTWDCDLAATLRSVERLAALGPDDLLAGHLGPVLGEAARARARWRPTGSPGSCPPVNLA